MTGMAKDHSRFPAAGSAHPSGGYERQIRIGMRLSTPNPNILATSRRYDCRVRHRQDNGHQNQVSIPAYSDGTIIVRGKFATDQYVWCADRASSSRRLMRPPRSETTDESRRSTTAWAGSATIPPVKKPPSAEERRCRPPMISIGRPTRFPAHRLHLQLSNEPSPCGRRPCPARTTARLLLDRIAITPPAAPAVPAPPPAPAPRPPRPRRYPCRPFRYSDRGTCGPSRARGPQSWPRIYCNSQPRW